MTLLFVPFTLQVKPAPVLGELANVLVFLAFGFGEDPFGSINALP